MTEMRIKQKFIEPGEYDNERKEVNKLALTDTVALLSGGVFKDYEVLTDVYFGLDISRIGNRTFENCKLLTDVWFAITDENKYIEIAEDAFRGCDKPITFHIFATAKKNKCLNEYASKHGFKVVGMI